MTLITRTENSQGLLGISEETYNNAFPKQFKASFSRLTHFPALALSCIFIDAKIYSW